MEPDRAANSGDNLTAARDYLTRAAMQLDQASTRRGAGKKMHLYKYSYIYNMIMIFKKSQA